MKKYEAVAIEIIYLKNDVIVMSSSPLTNDGNANLDGELEDRW